MSAGNHEVKTGNSARGPSSPRRMQRKENTLLDDSGSEATDLYQNGTSGAGETSGSVLRTRTWAASQAVRPASIPSPRATCATVPILLRSKGQQNSGPKTARETLRAYAAKRQYCMLLDDSGPIRNRRTSVRVQWETTVVRTRMVVSPPIIISAYYSLGIGET
jgi:hypothetical protein